MSIDCPHKGILSVETQERLYNLIEKQKHFPQLKDWKQAEI